MDSSLGSQNSRQSTSHCRNFDDVAGLKVSSRLSLLFIAEGRLLNETQQLLIPHSCATFCDTGGQAVDLNQTIFVTLFDTIPII